MTVSENAAVKPIPVDDPAGWRADDLAASDDWIYRLSDGDVAELDAAIWTVERSGAEIADVTETDFALPTLDARLRDIGRDIVHGRGVALIKGLPVARYTRRQAALACWGIGLRVGVPVSQNGKGHLLGHVKNLSGDDFETTTHRGYHTSSDLPWHADSCDVVGLLCLQTSRSGGESYFVSSVAIHNELIVRRPDLAEALAEPWYRDRRGEIPQGKAPWWSLPVFNYVGGKLVTSWQGKYIRSAQRFEELPRFTERQQEALDMMTRLAEELAFSMHFEPGDMQLLHNHVVLHRRSTYEDWPEPERKRHLLRLWLATPGGRTLPDGLVERYGQVGPSGRPAGIYVPGTQPTTPLDAE
ncbi:MAG: TauD/TfdA family dioxygenase [Alphaproteobacteria bacterium]